MNSESTLIAAPQGWKDEFEQLARSTPTAALSTIKPYHERSIKLEVAEHFVFLLFETSEVLRAALEQAEWLREWSTRPEAELHLPKEADDYPFAPFDFMRQFIGWFSLKNSIQNDGGTFLQDIQQHMIGIYFEEGSKPSEQRIRDELSGMNFVTQGSKNGI
jgi:hypothetical protein